MSMPSWLPSLLRTLLVVSLFYVATAHLVFAFRHPDLTDTQRFLRTGEALLWR